MYGANDNPAGIAKISCRDWEGDAKRLSGKIKCNGDFIAAIENFVNGKHFYQIDDANTLKAIFALYGELKMKQPNIEKELDMVLKEIEKQKP